MKPRLIVDQAHLETRYQPERHATRESLLSAAELLFSRNGYTSVSTRDLADAAGANLAAIKYHFGSKAKLFIEVVKRLMTSSGCIEARLDFNGPIHSAHDSAHAIGRYIFGFLSYLLNPSGPQACVMMLRESFTDHSDEPEMFEALISTVVEQFLRPLEDSLVRAITVLKPEMSSSVALLSSRSIAGQCAFYGSHRKFIERLDDSSSVSVDQIKKTAVHIASFSLSGLNCSSEVIQIAVSAINQAFQEEQSKCI